MSSEASSLAGHQQLGNLILIYDDNHISIEDDTDVAFSEDVRQALRGLRLAHPVRRLRRGRGGAGAGACRGPSAETDRPSFIAVRTIIGWPAPTKQNTGKAHGSALGEDEIRKTKEMLGLRPGRALRGRPTRCSRTPAQVVERGREPHARVAAEYSTRGPRPTRSASRCSTGMRHRTLPDGWADALPTFAAEKDGKPNSVATRAASGKVLTALAAGAARAVGRLGRPRREQQHHDGGRAELRPGRAPDQDVAGRPVRAHPALRHPRARDGFDHERHHAARRHPGLRRHVPGVQRLHAPAGPAGRADAAARRSTSGRTTRSGSARTARPTSRSSTWPRCARSRASTWSARPTPTRPPSCWRAVLEHTDRPGRPRAVPAEPAGARPGEGRPTPARAATSWRRRPPGGPTVILIATGSEVVAGAAGARAARGRGHRRPGSSRCRASSGSRRRPRPTSSRSCRRTIKARVSVEAGVPQGWREIVGDAGEIVVDRPLRRQRRGRRAVRAVRLHPRPRRRGRARRARAAPARSLAPTTGN